VTVNYAGLSSDLVSMATCHVGTVVASLAVATQLTVD